MLLEINADISSDREDTAFDTGIYDSQAKYVASIQHNELITKPTKNYYYNGADETLPIAEPEQKTQNENINIDIFDFDTCPQDEEEAVDEKPKEGQKGQ